MFFIYLFKSDLFRYHLFYSASAESYISLISLAKCFLATALLIFIVGVKRSFSTVNGSSLKKTFLIFSRPENLFTLASSRKLAKIAWWRVPPWINSARFYGSATISWLLRHVTTVSLSMTTMAISQLFVESPSTNTCCISGDWIYTF